MKKILTTTIVVLLIFCFSGSSYSQDARGYYEQGLFFKSAGEIDDAIDAFKKAIDKKYKFPDAFYELALCYMEKNTLFYRNQAEFAINHAIDMEPDSTKYLHALNDLRNKQLFIYDAHRVSLDILKKDSTNVHAMDDLAKYYVKRYNDLIYRVFPTDPRMLYDINLAGYRYGKEKAEIMLGNIKRDVEFSSTIQYMNRLKSRNSDFSNIYEPFMFDFSDFGVKQREKAVEMNNRIISVEPENRDALFRNGIFRLDSRDYGSFIYMFENIITNNDEDKDAYMFLGLGHSLRGEHEKSAAYYDKGLSLLDKEERNVYESVDFLHELFDPHEFKRNLSLQGIDTTGFWQRKDPLFITPFNERKLAHYGRVAEATLRFSVPGKNIAGWQTGRGRVWIRYGKPNLIRGYHEGKIAGVSFKHQIWYYDDFTFVFRSSNLDFYDNYELQIWNDINFEEIEPYIADKFPDYYEYNPRGRMFNFFVDMVRFRGEGRENEIKLYYRFPVDVIQMEQNYEYLNGSIHQGVFLFDENWNPYTSMIDTAEFSFDEYSYDVLSDIFHTESKSLNLKPGSYNLSVELVDPASGNTGVYRTGLDVVAFSRDRLQMSDILLAYNIEQVDDEKPVSRENIKVNANPSHVFLKELPIYFYFELYNLSTSGFGEANRYKVEYTLLPEEEKRGLLKRIFSRGGTGKGISVSSQITSSGKDVNQFLIIEHNLNKTGNYTLTIVVTDLLEGSRVEKSIKIRIVD